METIKKTVKSGKRIKLIEYISETLANEEIYGTIAYKQKPEDQIKQFAYPYILNDIRKYLSENTNLNESRIHEDAKKMLKWEGNVNTTVNHVKFFGTKHRPDMVLEIDNLKVAIEFKKGKTGSSIRESFGQCMVYAQHYDFVINCLIDCSEDNIIVEGSKGVQEQKFLEGMWKDYNVRTVFI